MVSNNSKRISVTIASDSKTLIFQFKTLDKAAVGVVYWWLFQHLYKKVLKEYQTFWIVWQMSVTKFKINLGTSRNGLNMDAVKAMGANYFDMESKQKDDSIACAVGCFFNAVDDNPFMAGAYHGDVVLCWVLVARSCKGNGQRRCSFDELCDLIQQTAFKITRLGQHGKEAAKIKCPFWYYYCPAPTPNWR